MDSQAIEAYGDDTASIVQFGEEVVTRMCEQLLKVGGVWAALLH